MSILTVRNLSPETHRRLKQRAAAHGRSMEAEARAILDEIVSRESQPFDLIRGLRQLATRARFSDAELAALTPDRSGSMPRAVDLGPNG